MRAPSRPLSGRGTEEAYGLWGATLHVFGARCGATTAHPQRTLLQPPNPPVKACPDNGQRREVGAIWMLGADAELVHKC
ncbi:hypothetical protein K458DRAFT_390668 [Lentithecium fluviatile CBS 122367]|uniref:Uncharacterized protein n=1 Tax=Lentithecium fluviatile CBS 122367 TaxID=1168545 RepID=A0A6G1IXS9_9PLEO|nr:hypothetical protein K458DRAFT_390668 [Lentithecium fluviatile CBS 122367]